MIRLDNNAAERAIRLPVVTRRNTGGSRNEDSARLAATAWTVTATAQMAGLNVLTYLTAYLDACGRNGGRPLPARASNGSGGSTTPGPDRAPRGGKSARHLWKSPVRRDPHQYPQ